MAGLNLNLIIGAALSNSVGHVFSSIQNTAKNTVKNTEKLQIGKKWAEEIVLLEKKLKANDMLAQKFGRNLKSIKVRNELIHRLADAKREAEKFGIDIKNAKKSLADLNREAARSERKEKITAAFQGLKENAANTAKAASGVGLVLKKGFGFIQTFARFESGMADVATLLDGDKLAKKARIGELGKAIRKMSVETGASLQDLQGGLYQTISAFGDNSETIDRLSIAAKAAIGGGSSTADALGLLSAVTKGYGDTSAEAAQKAMDLAFTTVKLGETDFPALAANMGKVVSTAGTLGVKIEELFGSFATLTGPNGNTDQVATQINAVLMALLKPSSDLERALRGLGYSSGLSAVKAEGFANILTKLQKRVHGNSAALTQMFGSSEAVKAILALTGAQAETFAQKTAAMYQTAGAAEAAYTEQHDTVENENRRLLNSFTDIAINIGQAILPTFKMMGGVLGDVSKQIGWWVENFPFLSKVVFTSALALTGFNFALKMTLTMRSLITFIRALEIGHYAAAAASKVATAGLWLWNHALKIAGAATKIFTGLQWLLNAAFIANPIGLIIVGITAFAGLAYIVYKNWEPIVQWFKESFSVIGDFIGSIFGGGDKKTLTAVSKIEDLNSGKAAGSISVAKDIPVQPTSVKNEKNVNVSMPNITINSANLDESLPTITEKVRAAVMAGVKDDMENAYAY